MSPKEIQIFAEQNQWTFLGEGMDNLVYTNGEKTKVFRIPKKADGESIIEREAEVLPILAKISKQISIPVPELRTVDYFFYAEYPFVSGKQFEELPLVQQKDFLTKLSYFLQSLHTFSDPAISVLPTVNCFTHFSSIYAQVKEELRDVLTNTQMNYAKNLFDSYFNEEKNKSISPKVIHGDISFEHVYYDSEKLAIIDWSDLQLADPAYEFHHLLREVPTEMHQILFDNYDTREDLTFWKRAYTYMYINTFDALLIFVRKNNTELVQTFLQKADEDMKSWMSDKN